MSNCKRCDYTKEFFCSCCPYRKESKLLWTFTQWLIALVMLAIALLSVFLWFNPRLV